MSAYCCDKHLGHLSREKRMVFGEDSAIGVLANGDNLSQQSENVSSAETDEEASQLSTELLGI